MCVAMGSNPSFERSIEEIDSVPDDLKEPGAGYSFYPMGS